ncbi:MAG: hypothetical protein WDW38_011592 [Sanguina aurantia]
MQANGRQQLPQQQQQQQPFAPYIQQPQQQQQQQQQKPQQPQPVSLARRAAPAPQPVLLNMTQVVNKQVITTLTAKSLGYANSLLVDTRRWEVVSFDLLDKQGVGSVRIASVPLSTVMQLGDVLLVKDETAANRTGFSGYDCMDIIGLEVKTTYGELLGKVRDFRFSPDNGAIASIIYDDFGKSWVPISFFDCYAISSDCIEAMGPLGIVVSQEARSRVWKESSGLLAKIPSLLRSVSLGQQDTQALLGPGSSIATTNGYRSSSYSMPQDYTYNQWESDIQRWEQETGLRYQEYVQNQSAMANRASNGYASNGFEAGGQQGRGTGRPALSAGRPRDPLPAQQQRQQQQPNSSPRTVTSTGRPQIQGSVSIRAAAAAAATTPSAAATPNAAAAAAAGSEAAAGRAGHGADGNTLSTNTCPSQHPTVITIPTAIRAAEDAAATFSSTVCYAPGGAGGGPGFESGSRRMDQWIEREDPQQRRQLQELVPPVPERPFTAAPITFPDSSLGPEQLTDGPARRQQ